MQTLLKYVSSFTDGRIRIRHPALSRADIITAIKDKLAATPGVYSAEINPRTCSLLLLYDPHALPREELMRQGTAWVREMEPRVSTVKERCLGEFKQALPGGRKLLNRGMLAALGLTVLSGGTGSKALHLAAGSLLTILASVHTFRHRKGL